MVNSHEGGDTTSDGGNKNYGEQLSKLNPNQEPGKCMENWISEFLDQWLPYEPCSSSLSSLKLLSFWIARYITFTMSDPPFYGECEKGARYVSSLEVLRLDLPRAIALDKHYLCWAWFKWCYVLAPHGRKFQNKQIFEGECCRKYWLTYL